MELAALNLVILLLVLATSVVVWFLLLYWTVRLAFGMRAHARKGTGTDSRARRRTTYAGGRARA